MRWFRRTMIALTAMAAVVPAGLAWACVGVVSLTVASPTVQPGGTLEVTGREFAQKVPVEIHLDSPTGPLLVTVPGPTSTMNSKFTVSVPVPSNVAGGQHFLVATQDYHDMNSGTPARSAFSVGTAAPSAPAPVARPAKLAAGSGPSGVSLVLIGLGVAAICLLAVGAWNVVASRRPLSTGAGATTTS